MEERTILRRISRGSQRALEAVMRQYSAYVVTVIHNRSRGRAALRDILCQGGFQYEQAD